VEDLHVAGMIKNHCLAKSIQDASWAKFISMLEYKARWYGRVFYKVPRFYASSKICSNCGHRMPKMSLDIREWTCPHCGAVHDRDINGAVNVLNKGLVDLYQLSVVDIEYKRRENLANLVAVRLE